MNHTYTVIVDDNFHYMDEDERYRHGEFDDCESAVKACKKIVDEFLLQHYEPGMIAEQLLTGYIMFGEDPFVSTTDRRRISKGATTIRSSRATRDPSSATTTQRNSMPGTCRWAT